MRENHTSLQEIGLPVGERCDPLGTLHLHSVLINPATNTLIALLQPSKLQGEGDFRVFFRRVDEPRYRELEMPDEAGAARSVVSCQSSPLAFVTLQSVGRPLPSGVIGVDNLGVYEVFLPSGRMRKLSEPAGREGSERVWISSLLSSSERGDAVYANVASQDPTGSVAYDVMKVDTVSGACELIHELPATFA
jgi:hypothetical protein